jgi:hypothetical protein
LKQFDAILVALPEVDIHLQRAAEMPFCIGFLSLISPCFGSASLENVFLGGSIMPSP